MRLDSTPMRPALTSTLKRAALALLLSFALQPSARAQTVSGLPRQTSEHALAQLRASEGFPIERYLNIRSATSPTLAPTGDRLAFLLNVTGTPQVWSVAATGGGWPEQLTFYTDRVDFVRFSPDGTKLLFGKARGGDENAQLYWMSPDGAQVRQLTDAPRIRYNFGSWSADGRRISYASNKRNPNFFDIYVMDVESGAETLVYQQDGSNAAVAWSSDGRFIVVSRASDTLSLDNDLYLVELASKTVTHLTPHTGAATFGDVHFTRDNRALVLSTNVAGEWQSLARLDLQTKRIEPATNAEWDTDATRMSVDGRLLAYALNREGFSELYVRRLTDEGRGDDKDTPVTLPGKGVVSGLDFSRDGRKLAFTFAGARFNPDVWLYDLKTRRLEQVTHASRAAIPQSSFVEPELIRYKTFDGRDIPAWYYRPRNAQASGASQSLPVIVSVHGGPEGQERPAFNPTYQYFLSRGYAVLAPNVRGSTGYGKTYTHLDDVKLREDSVKDLAASVEWLKTSGGADARRIAVMGGSYGGYMTLAAITLYPDLWAAAIEMFGISNFETNLRNTSGYRRKQREREYGTLANDLEFLRSISPIYKVDRIKAPLLVFQGKNDPRVPYTESEQIVKALRDRNAPVEYTLFEDEGHGFVKLANRLVVYPKIVDFLERHMK
ncbi:MAG TPA: S9 family peptidase [Pyrinomonadaceae bacterium]|nr:S9 family peptidase [Pyrinomonadaceae bacterium]